jgi:hypothetical protein
MKNKIGFMAIAMITVLATLGIGFSMWSQTVTITGSVNTGSVKIALSNATGTWVYKDETAGISPTLYTITGAVGTNTAKINNAGSFVYGPATGDIVVPTGGWRTADNANVVLIGCAYLDPSTLITTPTMDWFNIFPLGGGSGLWTADFTITNSGSIPVKFHAVTSPLISVNGGSTYSPIVTVTYGSIGSTTALEGYQLEPTGTINADVNISVPDNNSNQGTTSGSFTITLQAVQWNEYSGTVTQ